MERAARTFFYCNAGAAKMLNNLGKSVLVILLCRVVGTIFLLESGNGKNGQGARLMANDLRILCTSVAIFRHSVCCLDFLLAINLVAVLNA